MLRLVARCVLHRSSNCGVVCQAPKMYFSTVLQYEGRSQVTSNGDGKDNKTEHDYLVGKNITRKEKNNLLIKTLVDIEDNKEAIYGALDAWVAWEKHFPIAALKNVLIALENDQQWHRVVQVIKWMLSKGQGNTMNTYQQLIRALDKDHRVKEAHNIWMKKVDNDLHSVPWQACHLMISVYFRNNMFEHVVKLFKRLEAFDRKPSERQIVRKVVDACELLGLVDEKERLLLKYADLLNKNRIESKKRSSRVKSRKKEASSGRKDSVATDLKT